MRSNRKPTCVSGSVIVSMMKVFSIVFFCMSLTGFGRDGIVLCNTYNCLVKKSRRSFGLINRIHLDTLRTYRATENLSFFAA